MTSSFMAAGWSASTLAAAWLLAVYAVSLQGMVIRRVRANDPDAALTWVLGGALVVGTGIWAASFLTMVAMRLPIEVAYVRDVVLASWLPAIVIAAAAIWMQTYPGLRRRTRLIGAVMVAVGVQTLVLVNASSILLKPAMAWDAGWSSGAFVLILAGCALGSWLIQAELDHAPEQLRHLLVAVLVGSILWGGLFMQVSAARVPVGAACLSLGQLDGNAMEFVLTSTVLILLIMGHMGTLQDARNLTRNRRLSDSLRATQMALEEASLRDASTGLPNRAGFEKQLREQIEANGEQPLSLCVMRVNIDGFRPFTSAHGPQVGDGLMQVLATRVQGLLHEGDVLARSDSDELVLACHGLHDEHVTAALAQRLQDAVHAPCLVQGHELVVSGSIGVARYPDSATVEQLLSHANDAMLTARRAGGGVYCFFVRGMDRLGAEQVEMQRDLRHAVARQELALHFQPKLRARTGEVAGVEALLRWHHPTRGLVGPSEFIPVAERFGLIGDLGLWVIDQACQHLRLWHELGLDIPVAVNLSVHQLRQPDLVRRVRQTLRQHRVPARMLTLEVTESAAMEDIEASLSVFNALDQIGVRLSIDDFGTGYSSLSYLRRLPARQLKIDRSFVHDLESSLDAQAIVQAVVNLAHALDLQVVAEGVETQDQADILAQLHCDELQGFLFARPLPEAKLLQWLEQRGAPEPLNSNAMPLSWRHERAAPPDEDAEIATAWSALDASPP